MVLKTLALTIVALAVGTSAQAQRIELDGGNRGTIELGPSETAIDRALDGNLSVGIGEDGLSLDAGGGVELGVNGRSIGISGQLPTLGNPAPEHPVSPQAGPIPSPPDAPNVDPATRAQATSQAGGCLEPEALQQMHDAFLASQGADTPHYIRRTDITNCSINHRPALAERLNADPAIRSGLSRMNVNSEDVAAARWAPDGGLEIFTAPR